MVFSRIRAKLIAVHDAQLELSCNFCYQCNDLEVEPNEGVTVEKEGFIRVFSLRFGTRG